MSWLAAWSHADVLDVADSRLLNRYITSYFSYLEDPSHQLTADAVIAQPQDQQWTPITQPSISFGYTASAYWLTSDWINRSDQTRTLYLELAYPKISRVDLYRVVDGAVVMTQTILASDPVDQRRVHHRHPVFPLQLAPGERVTLYLRVENRFAMALPIRLWEPAQFDPFDKHYLLLQGIYFGCMLAMLVYNGFIYLSTRDRSFVYYVLFVASQVGFVLFDRGFAGEYWWRNDEDLNYRLYVAFFGLSVCLATGFCRVYLTVSAFSRRLSHTLLGAELLGWGLALWGLLAPSMLLINIIATLMLAAGTLSMGSALYVYRRGLVIARFYLMAWMVIIVGGFIHVGANMGYFPFNFLTEHLLQIANMVEAMLLSFGLGYRIKLLQAERETARIETLQERQNASQEKEINEAKSQFFASVSHEFRTPLTAILGYAELAQTQQLPTGEKDKFIRTIHQSAQHMLQLINDVLDLSKIEAQKMEYEILPVDVPRLCRELQGFIDILARNKGLHFRIEYTFPLPRIIHTDPTRLKQVLINLCSNAVKFTEHGGVELTLRCDPAQGLLYFAVHDSGVGIRDDVQQALFGAFQQGERSTSRHYGGTGLGLYLSRVIANDLGGDISVQSQLGQGSTFTLSVRTGDLTQGEWMTGPSAIRPDASIASPAHATLTDANSISPSPPKRVLIVDDNVVNIRLLEFHLKRMGVEAVCVQDGLEAITRILNESFDVVLMDINMPVMDGITAVKLLREKKIAIPIFALTGSLDAASVDAFAEAGFSGTLAKPYELERIRACILGPEQN